MSQYEIRYIGLGKIEQGRLVEAEKSLNDLAASAEIILVAPYMIMLPGRPMMGSNNVLMAGPPTVMNGLMIVTKKEAANADPVN